MYPRKNCMSFGLREYIKEITFRFDPEEFFCDIFYEIYLPLNYNKVFNFFSGNIYTEYHSYSHSR